MVNSLLESIPLYISFLEKRKERMPDGASPSFYLLPMLMYPEEAPRPRLENNHPIVDHANPEVHG